jgi:hypothetical protein
MDTPETPSRIGRFIQTYHSFLSTFVIGAAGLIATSIWQFKQSEIARRQAESQQAIAQAQAENQWRIERAEILAKNLQVLGSRGPTSADQRYGVLLSLTRGAILDPELAVSYALELGKDNPDYMKSVLASTTDKDYDQLAHAVTVTCEQRYGLTRQVDICKGDDSGPRSLAIAEVVGDDTEAWAVTTASVPTGDGRLRTPIAPLADAEPVRKDPWRFAALYAPAITSLYQKQQWAELRRIEAFSDGAHLVSALVVARSRTGEIESGSDANSVEALHAAERAWLAAELANRACDDDCRSRFADYMLTGLADAEKDYGVLLLALLERPPAEARPSIERLHTRFLRCQVEASDADALRDRVLVPALADLLGQPKPDAPVLADLVGLLALESEPTDPTAQAAWSAVIGRYAAIAAEGYRTNFVERRAAAEEQRQNPPASTRRISFCKAPEAQDTSAGANP